MVLAAFKQTTASIKWRLAPELEWFWNLKKLRKQRSSFSPLGNLIQEGKKGWDNLPEVFTNLADQQSCSSKCEIAHWTTGTTWQRVRAQRQTLDRGNQSLFSMHGLPVLSHHPHAWCPDPPPTAEPVEAAVTTPWLHLTSQADETMMGCINHFQSFKYHWS